MDFFSASKQGSVTEWEELIKTGENPNTLDQFGTTPLSWVVKMSDLNLFKSALALGADPNFPFRSSGNLIFELFSQNKRDFLNVLVENPNRWAESKFLFTRDKEGNTIFHKSVNPSFDFVWDFAKTLLNEDVLVYRNEEGRSIFLESIVEDNFEASLYLLEKYPMVISDLDHESKNALHLASERNLQSIVELLLGKGLDVNANDDLGNSALFLAASADATESLELILKAGANPFVWGEGGESITRLLNREKFSHSLKTWKKYTIRLAKQENKESNSYKQLLDYVSLEKPFSPNELAEMKLIDYL
ncbi:hypothetical protein P3G55_07900 [Leptospira sp. 96542]|nr:hypothetical protein [Leptospira sp. 96542]